MPLTFPTKPSGDFKPIPAGSHIAICDIVADLGIQPGNGSFPDPKHKVYLRFEIPAERVEYEQDGKKYNRSAVVGAYFTASMHEKATLRKRLEGWRGKAFTDAEAAVFDVVAVLGKYCMLTLTEVEKGGKMYSNITGISPLPKGVPPPVAEAENKPLLYIPEQPDAFNELPEWMKEKIRTQLTPEEIPQTKKGSPESVSLEITDDDIPF